MFRLHCLRAPTKCSSDPQAPARPADVMEKTWHRFRVRQRVHYYPEGRASKKLTGPWIILASRRV